MLAEKKPSLFVLIGVSGSGKSTFAKAGLPLAYTVSTDAIRAAMLGDESIQTYGAEVFRRAYDSAHMWLKLGYNVIFDATNTTARGRQRLLDNVADIDCEKIAVYMNTPLHVAKKRNANRARVVEEKVIDRQYQQLLADANTIPYQFDKIIIVGGWKHE